jgi:cytoskeletal protein CcmA (bactofilin family)
VSSDPVEVHGTLEGDSRVTARYVVGESGRVFGNIEATNLIVAGQVTAGVLVAERIELKPTARVSANLRARVVAIANGALLEGGVDSREAPAPAGVPRR